MTNPDPHVERLVNLTFAFLDAANNPHKTGLTLEELHQRIDAYKDMTYDGFRTTFRRDRQALRRAGVPLEYVAEPGGHSCYRIHNEHYALPEITFTEAEAAVLGLAGDLGGKGALAAFNRSGWTKLAATGLNRDLAPSKLARGGDDLALLEPAVLDGCLKAVRYKKSISFDYRPNPTAEVVRRRMDPWGLVSLRSRIYLVGFDLDKQAPRTFRIRRILSVDVGEDATNLKPQDLDLNDEVENSLAQRYRKTTVVFQGPRLAAMELVRDPRCEELERDTWRMKDVEHEEIVRTLAGLAPQVRALKPQTVVDDIIALLRLAAGKGESND